MTTAEFIDELRQALGNRTDITDARYVRWLNWALFDICSIHRQRVFPARRFKSLQDVLLITLPVPSGTVAAATDTTVTLPPLMQQPGRPDYYVDCVAEITAYDTVGAGTDPPTGLLGQQRLITGYNPLTNVVTLANAWDVTPDTFSTITIMRRHYNVVDTTQEDTLDDIFAFQRVQTALDATELELVEWSELSSVSPFNTGSPTKIARHGDSFLLDAAPEEPLTLRAFVYRFPPKFDVATLDADSPLPDNWDQVIILGAKTIGFRSLMEPDRADEAAEEYKDAATNIREESAVEAEYKETGLKLRRD